MKRLLSLVIGTFMVSALSTAALAQTPEEAAHEALVRGNERYVSGNLVHNYQYIPERRTELTNGQHPQSIIVSCSDSRTSPELVFDQGLGDIFVIRTAGHVVDNAGLASIEYGVEHLHVPLVVVMGHEKCGAVNATIEGVQGPGHLHSLTSAITPAVKDAEKHPSGAGLLDDAVHANVDAVAAQLVNSSPVLAGAVKAGHAKIIGAYYDLDSGEVRFCEPGQCLPR